MAKNYKKPSSQLWVQVVCIVLVVLMLIGAIVTIVSFL